MQKLVKKVCVGAAIIFAALEGVAVQELETLNGMPDASDNVWRYYAKGEEGNPTNVNCVVQGDWVFGAAFDAGSGALSLNSYVAGEGVLNLLNTKVETAVGVKTEVKSLTFPAQCQKIPMTELWATDATDLPYMGVRKDLDNSLATTNDANYHIKRIYIKSDLVKEAKDYNFSFCFGLTNIILRCPNLVKWGKRVIFYTSVTNDIKEIVSPNVQSMGLYALCWWTPNSPSGYLTNLITGDFIVTNQLGDISYESWGSASNVYLRGDNYMGSKGNGIDEGTLLKYGNGGYLKKVTIWWPKVRQFGVKGQWFTKSCTSVEELCLYLPSLTNMVNDSLTDTCLSQAGGSVYLLGPAYKNEDKTQKMSAERMTHTMGRMIEGFKWNKGAENDSNANNANLPRFKIYCSKRWGWKEALEQCSSFKKLTDEVEVGTYEANNAPEGCFGVWAAGGRRTYIIDYPQGGEGFGLVIRIR